MSNSLPLVFTDVVVEFNDDDFSCSITRAEVTNDTPILTAKTLCGPKQGVGRATYALELEGLQDYFEALSLALFLKDHHGEAGTFSFTWVDPNNNGQVFVSGALTFVTPTFGGTADEIATFSITLPITGEPTISPAVSA